MTRCKMVDLGRNRNLSARDTENKVNAALEDIQSSGNRVLSATLLDNRVDYTLMILFDDENARVFAGQGSLENAGMS